MSNIPTTNHTTLFTHTQNFITKRRPWSHFLDYHSISIPISYHDTISRIRQNLNYFRVNYAILMLLILFLSLIYHPLSMILFLIILLAWLFLYFFKHGKTPVIVFNRVVDDRVILVGLSLLTVFALAFTNVGMNVLVSLVVVVVVVGLHAAFRSPDDLFLDEEDAVEGGLVSVVGSESGARSGYGLD